MQCKRLQKLPDIAQHSLKDAVLRRCFSGSGDDLHGKLEEGDALGTLGEHALEGEVEHDAVLGSLTRGHCSAIKVQQSAKCRAAMANLIKGIDTT